MTSSVKSLSLSWSMSFRESDHLLNRERRTEVCFCILWSYCIINHIMLSIFFHLYGSVPHFIQKLVRVWLQNNGVDTFHPITSTTCNGILWAIICVRRLHRNLRGNPVVEFPVFCLLRSFWVSLWLWIVGFASCISWLGFYRSPKYG